MDDHGQLRDPALQTRFERITKELRCLVCQNESIADSNVDLAADLRRQVREMLVAGKSDDAIFKFMTDRYGEFVRFAPPLTPKTALIWGAPFLHAAAGRHHHFPRRTPTLANAAGRMSAFLIIAALMAAIAAAIVAVPLLRDKRSRIIGAVAACLVAGAAAGLYPLWSNWDWHAPAQSRRCPRPDVLAMVAKLEQHMRDDPNDIAGWLMLGRSYLALQRMDDAVNAYDRAHQLNGNSAEAALGLGEAISLRAGGQISPEASQLFEDALKLEPNNPKALLYGGFAAATRGDRDLARSRWQALKDLHPPPQIEQMLDARIAALGAAEESGTNASPAGTSASPQGSAAAQVTVNIRIAPALKSRLKSETPLFVFAREPDSRGPPLAAKRLTSDAIGTQVQLSAADSMMPGRVLAAGQRVSITARVSFSGQPIPSAGDLYGELSYDVGHDGALDLLIDRVAE